MSIQGPRYKPSQEYILAALELNSATIEEIYASAATVEHIEMYEEWYGEEIQSQHSKLKRTLNYPLLKTVEVNEKIFALLQKIIQTTELVEDRLAESLYERVKNYTLVLQNTADREITSSYREIAKSFLYFKGVIDNCEHFSSNKANCSLLDTTQLIDNSDALIHSRLSLYERKHKVSFTQSSSLACKRTDINDETPQHLPTTYYCVAKAQYRQARIKELGLCLEQQSDIQIHAGWFQKMQQKESMRIDALESFAKRCNATIPEQITACRTAFARFQAQCEERLKSSTSVICDNPHSPASLSSSSSSSYLLISPSSSSSSSSFSSSTVSFHLARNVICFVNKT